jgi:hypothetical protein
MVGTWLILLLILAWQLPFLIARRQWPELWAFVFLWAIGALYASLVVADAGIPTVTQLIIRLVEYFFPAP